MKKKVKHSFAVYKDEATGALVGRVDECAKILMNWPELPARLNDIRAMEIAKVAESYLNLVARLKPKKRKHK